MVIIGTLVGVRMVFHVIHLYPKWSIHTSLVVRFPIPDGGWVDHVNKDSRDNRFSHFGLAADHVTIHVLNARNCRRRMLDSNTSGVTGMTWDIGKHGSIC